MYIEVVRPVLDILDQTHLLPSEDAHIVARKMLYGIGRYPQAYRIFEALMTQNRKRYCDPRLAVDVAGVALDNNYLVGAGWDKVGSAIPALYALGAGGVVFGGVPYFEQKGNPKSRFKPRQHMLSSEVAMNWLGFNSPGAERVSGVVARSHRFMDRLGIKVPIFANLAKNEWVSFADAPMFYQKTTNLLLPLIDGIELAISCPNSKDSRKQQTDMQLLKESSESIHEEMNRQNKSVPLLLKIDSDSSDLDTYRLLQAVNDYNYDGIVCSNTTPNSDVKAKYGEKWRNIPGGVSGTDPDLQRQALYKVAFIKKHISHGKVVGGAGGIDGPQIAIMFHEAGADFLQGVTNLRGRGLGVIENILKGCSSYLDQTGSKQISDIVGVNYHLYSRRAS